MAYSISWDEGVPVGATTPAADIDTEIQKVKTSLRERLEAVLPDFDDDLLDPKKITIDSDVAANKPTNPDYAGQLYFAYDIATLYIGNAALEWVPTGGLTVEEGEPEAVSQTFVVGARLTGDQIITIGGAWATISGWSPHVNKGNFYTGTAPTRFTIPAAGTYLIDGSFAMESSGYEFNIGYTVNGGGVNAGLAVSEADAAIASASLCQVATLAVGDYIEFKARNLGLVLQTLFGASYTHIRITRLP